MLWASVSLVNNENVKLAVPPEGLLENIGPISAGHAIQWSLIGTSCHATCMPHALFSWSVAR
jgi:hypothetical protein